MLWKKIKLKLFNVFLAMKSAIPLHSLNYMEKGKKMSIPCIMYISMIISEAFGTGSRKSFKILVFPGIIKSIMLI